MYFNILYVKFTYNIYVTLSHLRSKEIIGVHLVVVTYIGRSALPDMYAQHPRAHNIYLYFTYIHFWDSLNLPKV